eukprot:823126-Rhodomonas_salina.1
MEDAANGDSKAYSFLKSKIMRTSRSALLSCRARLAFLGTNAHHVWSLSSEEMKPLQSHTFEVCTTLEGRNSGDTATSMQAEVHVHGGLVGGGRRVDSAAARGVQEAHQVHEEADQVSHAKRKTASALQGESDSKRR